MVLLCSLLLLLLSLLVSALPRSMRAGLLPTFLVSVRTVRAAGLPLLLFSSFSVTIVCRSLAAPACTHRANSPPAETGRGPAVWLNNTRAEKEQFRAPSILNHSSLAESILPCECKLDDINNKRCNRIKRLFAGRLIAEASLAAYIHCNWC